MSGPISLFSNARVAPTPPTKEKTTDVTVTVKPASDTLSSAEAVKASEETSFFACICTFFLTALASIYHYLSSWFNSSPELKKTAVDETPKGLVAAPSDERSLVGNRMEKQFVQIYASVEETWNKWKKPENFACRLIICAKIFKKKTHPEAEPIAHKIYKAAKYFDHQNLKDFQNLKGLFQKMRSYVSKTADLEDFKLAVAWGYKKTENEPRCTLFKYSYSKTHNQPHLGTYHYGGHEEIAKRLSEASAFKDVVGIKNLFDEQGNLIHGALTGRVVIDKNRSLPLDRIVANQILLSFKEFFKGYKESKRVFPCRCLAFLQLDTSEPEHELRHFKFGKLCNNKIEVTKGLGLFQQILPLKSVHLKDFKLDVLLIHTNKALPNKFDYTTISFSLANSAVNNDTPSMRPSQEESRSSEELMKELSDACPAFAAFGKQEDILSSTGYLLDKTFSQEHNSR